MALPQTAFEELGLEVLAHLLQPHPPPNTMEDVEGTLRWSDGKWGRGLHSRTGEMHHGRERERLWKEFSRDALTEPQTRTADHTSVCFLFSFLF